MLDDSQIRQMMIKALPGLIDPAKLEVGMLDYDAAAGYWYRGSDGVKHGRAPAIQRTETEIAAVLASDLGAHFVDDAMKDGISPHEGKPGRHPLDCTCSKHRTLNGSR